MSAKLARTIHTRDGATLRTRGEAVEYMIAMLPRGPDKKRAAEI